MTNEALITVIIILFYFFIGIILGFTIFIYHKSCKTIGDLIACLFIGGLVGTLIISNYFLEKLEMKFGAKLKNLLNIETKK